MDEAVKVDAVKADRAARNADKVDAVRVAAAPVDEAKVVETNRAPNPRP